jgi:hypothetical protein
MLTFSGIHQTKSLVRAALWQPMQVLRLLSRHALDSWKKVSSTIFVVAESGEIGPGRQDAVQIHGGHGRDVLPATLGGKPTWPAAPDLRGIAPALVARGDVVL